MKSHPQCHRKSPPFERGRGAFVHCPLSTVPYGALSGISRLQLARARQFQRLLGRCSDSLSNMLMIVVHSSGSSDVTPNRSIIITTNNPEVMWTHEITRYGSI